MKNTRPVSAIPEQITAADIKRQFPPWRIFRTEYGGLYPLSNYYKVRGRNYSGPVWNFDIVEVGNSAVLTGNRFLFGRELPAKAKRIIQDARKYDREFDPRKGSAQKKETYLQNAARRFSDALTDRYDEET